MRSNVSLFSALCLPILFLQLLSCGAKTAAPALPPPAPVAAEPADAPDSEAFSYAAAAAETVWAERASVALADPFPRAFLVDAAGISAVPSGDGDAQALFGQAAEARRRDASAWGEARRGDYRYRVADGAVAAELSGADGVRGLWRFAPDRAVVAGPLAFSDAVVAATEKPSLITLDRKTGALLRETELRSVAIGPLYYLEAAGLLAAVNADGTVTAYAAYAGSAEAPDPVEAFLRPGAEALERMESRLRERLGRGDEKPKLAFFPYGPRDAVPGTDVSVFRLDFPKAQKSRLHVADGGPRPFLLEVFSAEGEELASNLDYLGAEAALEYVFQADTVYFVAAAVLARDAADSGSPRLAVVPK